MDTYRLEDLHIRDRGQLESAIARGMQARGWTAYDAVGLCKTHDLVGRFTHSAFGDVIALIEFAVDAVYTGSLPRTLDRYSKGSQERLSLRAWVGLKHPPTDQFVTNLIGRAWHGSVVEREIDLSGDVLWYRMEERNTSKKTEGIAEALVKFSVAQADSLAEGLSSVEQIYQEMYREIEGTGIETNVAPSKPAPMVMTSGADRYMALVGMLVCSGRLDSAREGLRELIRLSEKENISRDRRYFIKGMRRLFYEDTVDVTVPRWDVRQLGDQSDALRGMSEAQDRWDVYTLVCRKAKGMSRGHLRAALEQVDIEQGFAKDPLSVEFYVTQATRKDGMLTRLRSIRRAMRLGVSGSHSAEHDGRSVVDVLRTHKEDVVLDDVRRPDRAVYEVLLVTQEWSIVRLTEDAAVWLEDVAGCLRHDDMGVYLAEVWFVLDKEHASGDPVIVNIGGRRIGLLEESAALRYRPVLRTANELGEIPWAHGRFVTRSSRLPGVLLVVPLPVVLDNVGK